MRETWPPWRSMSFWSSPCLTPVADSANVQPSNVHDGDPPPKKLPVRAERAAESLEEGASSSENAGGNVLP